MYTWSSAIYFHTKCCPAQHSALPVTGALFYSGHAAAAAVVTVVVFMYPRARKEEGGRGKEEGSGKTKRRSSKSRTHAPQRSLSPANASHFIQVLLYSCHVCLKTIECPCMIHYHCFPEKIY